MLAPHPVRVPQSRGAAIMSAASSRMPRGQSINRCCREVLMPSRKHATPKALCAPSTTLKLRLLRHSNHSVAGVSMLCYSMAAEQGIVLGT
eukprot:158278-Chlamydomonas_euryale.AAC.4